MHVCEEVWFPFSMKIVVVGGHGWVSRTAVSQYVENQGNSIEDICAYESSSRTSKPISGKTYPIKAWVPKEKLFRVDIFIPAAFLTLNKYLEEGEETFRRRNIDLISNVCRYI